MIKYLRNFYCVIRYEAKNLLNKAIIPLIILMAPTFAYSDQKVFILGDSLTHGFGLSVEEGLVNQLTNWFSGAGLELSLIHI